MTMMLPVLKNLRIDIIIIHTCKHFGFLITSNAIYISDIMNIYTIGETFQVYVS